MVRNLLTERDLRGGITFRIRRRGHDADTGGLELTQREVLQLCVNRRGRAGLGKDAREAALEADVGEVDSTFDEPARRDGAVRNSIRLGVVLPRHSDRCAVDCCTAILSRGSGDAVPEGTNGPLNRAVGGGVPTLADPPEDADVGRRTTLGERAEDQDVVVANGDVTGVLTAERAVRVLRNGTPEEPEAEVLGPFTA